MAHGLPGFNAWSSCSALVGPVACLRQDMMLGSTGYVPYKNYSTELCKVVVVDVQ